MKKFYLIAALSCLIATAHAEKTLNISTYGGTDLTPYAGQTVNVSVTRYLITGWNTISLPFALSESQLNEIFGNDCKLEKLIGVENDGTEVKLNFQDCKTGGIQPNTPYILYYNGETGNKRIYVENATIYVNSSVISFKAQGTGETVEMACAQKKTDATGLYGVLAKDNSEAKFVNTDAITSGFFATRCYVKMSSGNVKTLSTNHIGDGEATSIAQIADKSEIVDVYSISGSLVASQIPVAEINNLQKGIYVVKDKKIIVK